MDKLGKTIGRLIGAALLIGCYIIAIGGTAFVITAGIMLARGMFS